MEETIFNSNLGVFYLLPALKLPLFSQSTQKGKGIHIRERSRAYMSGHSEISSLSPRLPGRNYDWVRFDEVYLFNSISSEKDMHKVCLFKMLAGKPSE